MTANSPINPQWSADAAQERLRLTSAARFLPGGEQTMILLAALSRDARVRDAAWRFRNLTAAEKEIIPLERVCCGAGIEAGEFIGNVAATAWELGVDTGVLIGSMAGTVRWGREHSLLPPDRADAATFAWFRDVGLSQAQVARLFLATARTIRRWESGESAPTAHQQFIAYLLTRYAARSVRRFLKRFVIS